MTIRPVDLNGMLQMTHDVSQVKQQEDNRPILNQQNIEIQIAKEAQNQTQRVKETEETEQQSFRYDAKEKGSSSYNEQQKKKKKEQQKEDKVTIKGSPTSFDVKI